MACIKALKELLKSTMLKIDTGRSDMANGLGGDCMESKMIVKNLENIVSKANIEEVLMKKVGNIMRPEKVISEVTAELTKSDGHITTQEVDFDTLIKWIVSMKTYGWAKAYGGTGDDVALASTIAPNGDIIVAGVTESFGAGNEDVWVLRLDENGNIKWQKAYGGSGDDEAYTVAIADNGDIIVAGWTESFGAGGRDFWVLRLDEDGNIKWQKAYGGSCWDEAWGVTIADNGDIIVVGRTTSFGARGYDFWILRLDEDGNIKWQKACGGSDNDVASEVTIAPNGDIVVAGYTYSFGAGDVDFWVLRLDEDGNIKWQKAYGGSSYDKAYAVAIAPNGDIIVVGYTESFGAGGRDFWVLRLDEDGNIKWQKAYGGSCWDEAWGVTIADNGDIIVVGTSILRLDENGNIKWQKVYEGCGATTVTIADNTDIIVGDTTFFGAGNLDMLLLRLDENGNVSTSQLTVTDTNCTVTDTNCTVTDTNCTITDTSCTVTETDCVVTETDCVVTEL